jgi:hypothetical protein
MCDSMVFLCFVSLTCMIVVGCHSGADPGGARTGDDGKPLAIHGGGGVDRQTAIAICEDVCLKIYGESVLRQRPWIVTETEDAYEIRGNFTGSPRRRGGVAEVKIRKADGYVLSVTHGK